MGALIARQQPSAVINAAYVQGGPTLQPVTADAPGAMAAACADVGSRFVHVSTDVVFDGTTERPYREDDPTCPMHDYGQAKEAAEQSVARADPTAVIVRTSLLFGDATDPGPQALMVTDPAMTFFDDEFRSPIHVSTLAAACLELAGRPDVHGPLHVAGADIVDRYEFARRVAPLVGVDPADVAGGPGPRGTRPRNCPLDCALAYSVLETRLPGVREALP
ncbi:MAG: sugar nucleotide-binding protein [Acidimicrobiales bacterium]|nr:sugar nucleotide-binding protein [Acidimicrobiales bacterium]